MPIAAKARELGWIVDQVIEEDRPTDMVARARTALCHEAGDHSLARLHLLSGSPELPRNNCNFDVGLDPPWGGQPFAAQLCDLVELQRCQFADDAAQ